MQSPPQLAVREPCIQEADDVFMVSSNPRTRQEPRRAPEDGQREVTRAVIMSRRDDHRQSNGCFGPNVDEPTPRDGGYLPFKVGCSAFTCELRQICWPSTRMFKPEIPEKYDGRLNQTEFLSIYTIVVQPSGGRDEKVFTNYFLLALKSNVRSWLMHLPEYSISS